MQEGAKAPFLFGICMLINSHHRHSALPLFIALLLPVLLQLLAPFMPLEYDRNAIAAGQWWRLITGGWLHHNLAHLLMNQGALLLLWLWFVEFIPRWTLCSLLLLLVFCVDMALFFLDPVTLYYWGLSAALHGLFAYATLLALTRGEKQALIWLVMLIAKLWFDFHRIDQSTAVLIGTRVHSLSHLFGAICGGIIGVFCLLYWKLKLFITRPE